MHDTAGSSMANRNSNCFIRELNDELNPPIQYPYYWLLFQKTVPHTESGGSVSGYSSHHPGELRTTFLGTDRILIHLLACDGVVRGVLRTFPVPERIFLIPECTAGGVVELRSGRTSDQIMWRGSPEDLLENTMVNFIVEVDLYTSRTLG